MAEKKRFVLRLNAEQYELLVKWADDEFRSVNGQIEYILHRALERAGRLPKRKGATDMSSTKEKESS